MSVEEKQTRTVEFDPETATYEELVAAAQKEADEEAKRQQEQGQTEQQRDETGKFLKREQSSSKREQTEEVDEIVYRREIDLGDGGGVQVFEGATPDEVIDKLAKAQENATRKIRELTAAKKAEDEKKPARTPEQEWILSQELLANPTDTISKMFEEVVGMPPTAFKSRMDRLAAFEKAQSEEQAAQEFITKHPEYVPNARNAQRIEKYVRTYELDGTKAESIEKAYADLVEGGLLETKAAEKTQQTQETTQQTRIVSETQAQGRQRTSSGISSKRTVTNRAPEPTEEELYNLPYDKLRALAISEAQANS
jgi:hypothetical protein